MYYNPYSEPSAPPEPTAKKYSLRRRYQNPLRQQLDRSKYVRYEQESFFQSAGQERGKEGEGREGYGFNCMQSAQRILDFNQATSVSLKNHTKTLSTTPSAFENPFAPRTPPCPNKHSLASSQQQLSHTHKSTKTALSHNSKQPAERLRTENNSQPLSTVNCYGLTDDYSEGDRRGKVSLKNTAKLTSQSKSELLICLKYSDLRNPITNNRPPRLSLAPLEQRQPETGLGKYLCSNIKSQPGGCQCHPKCPWIDRWLASLPQERLDTPSPSIPALEWEATLKQIDRDLPRTQPEHPTFQQAEYLSSLRQVLVGYARLDAEVGYVQGMNFIAAAVVFHARSSHQALRVMEGVMRGCDFRKILLRDLALSHLVARRCLYELKRLAFDLYHHFIQQEVQIEVFITSWYFSLLGSFVPLTAMHLVVDKFLRSQFTGLNELIITLLILLKPTLLALTDHALMMAFSGAQIAQTAARIDWAELVERSEHLLLEPLPL